MTCDYCGIDRASYIGVLTWLGHRVNLCGTCARHAISPYRPRRARPPARDGPEADDRRQT